MKNTSLASKHIKILTNYFDIKGEQNDAHEFLTFLFEKLNTEILDISKVLTDDVNREKEAIVNSNNKEPLGDFKVEQFKDNTPIIKSKDEYELGTEAHKFEFENLHTDNMGNKNTENMNGYDKNKNDRISNKNKIPDLKSLLASSDKHSKNLGVNDKNQIKENRFNKIKEIKINHKNFINIDNIKDDKEMKDNDGWEEVKKGGNRMKMENNIKSFDISIIGNIFQGILKHDLETKGLSTSKCLIEPFFVLSLDLADHSLNNCFEKFFSRKKVENISNPSASFYQRAYIEKLPKILIIHVKGFYYDKVAHKIIKITKELDYPFELNLKKDYFSPSVYNQCKDHKYELISSNNKKHSFIESIYNFYLLF